MDGVVIVVVDCKVVEAVEQESMFVVVERVAVVVELVHMRGVAVVEQGVVAGVEEVLLGERIVEHSFVELDTMEKHFWAKQELQLLAEFQNSLH
jgi:hypothetical protein